MAQMKMDNSTEHNLNKTIAFMRGAMRKGADLIIFPELQLSPFSQNTVIKMRVRF